jgi:hypothetical protein
MQASNNTIQHLSRDIKKGIWRKHNEREALEKGESL